MRNQLLNFRPRTMTVEVQEGDLEEIYDRLVLKKSKKKLLQFISRTDSLEHEDESNFEKSDEKQTELPHKEESEVSRKGHEKNPSSDNREDDRNLKPESEDQVINNTAHPTEGQISLKINDNTINGSSSTEDALNDGENSLLWDSPAPDQETLQKNKEIILSTDLTGSELQRRLFYINQRARSMMEEQGYNILYLALGFLKWQEENGNTDSYNCYMYSGNSVLWFKKDYLNYNSDGWIGFNNQNNFFDCKPDSEVFTKIPFYFPGTAYNLNFVVKKSE